MGRHSHLTRYIDETWQPDAVTRLEWLQVSVDELDAMTITAVTVERRVAPVAPDLAASVAWMADANCNGMAPDIFHPEIGQKELARQAKAVCRGCAVRVECLTYAMADKRLFGIWGATTTEERKAMRRTAGRRTA